MEQYLQNSDLLMASLDKCSVVATNLRIVGMYVKAENVYFKV